MTDTRNLWKILGAILLLSFGVLLYMGREIYLAAPPMPKAVQTTAGQTVFTQRDIETGREVWQTTGGQQQGSIWGHGAYVAPDWSADWLHREATGLLELWATRDLRQILRRARRRPAGRAEGAPAAGNPRQHLRCRHGRRHRLRRPRAVIAQTAAHYDGLFGSDVNLEHAARAVRDEAEPGAGSGQARGADRVLLLDVLVDRDQSSRRERHLHQQLAVRAAGRQHADGADVPVDVRQHPGDARRHRRARLVLRDEPRQGRAAGRAGQRSAQVAEADALDEGHGQVFLGRHRTDPGAGDPRRHHRALRRRRPGVLRHTARRSAALRGHAQLAPAARGALDRHRVARHRPVHRTGDFRARTEVPALRRQLPVHLPARDRRRRARRPVVRRDAEDGPRRQLLVRPPGLRVHRHRPLLAGLPVRRPDGLAGAGRPRAVARAQGARRQPLDHDAACSSPRSRSACSTAPA